MSPGFITSNLVGVDEHGVLIKEFEASHGMDTRRVQPHPPAPNSNT
jgi:hypothetical protein